MEADLRLKDIASPFKVPVPVISLKDGWEQVTVRFSPEALITIGTDSSAPAPHIVSVHFPEMSAAQADNANMHTSQVAKSNTLRMILSFVKCQIVNSQMMLFNYNIFKTIANYLIRSQT